MQANTAWSPTPRSVSLRRVRLRTVLVTFGFSENIQKNSKDHHMYPSVNSLEIEILENQKNLFDST